MESRAAFGSRCLLTAALAFLVAYTLQAQSDAGFAWPDSLPWRSSWQQLPADCTLVLEDDLSIRLRNIKAAYLAFHYEHHRVVRFGDVASIKRYGPVVLPESLDPPFDEHGKPYTRLETRPYPLLFNLRVDHFAARVIHADGTCTELPIATRAAHGFLGNPLNMQATMSITHYPEGIMPGDVVEYRWKYMLPWDTNAPYTSGWRGSRWVDNWTRLANWRIFFHQGLPVAHQRIALRYHAKHGVNLAGEAPTRIERVGDERTATWEHTDLPGCMDEVNARPADDLPFASVFLQADDLRYQRRERLSGLPVTQQPWLQAIRRREANALWWRRVSMKRVPDRQNMLIKRFIAKECAGIPDSLGARRMEVLHERIARDFDYESDRDWYMDLDQGLPRMGDQVNEERIRDISRYDIYSKLLNALRLNHVTAYVLDKRAGRLDDRFIGPMTDNEWLFGVRDGEDMLWMHPKRMRNGWFANELPFYWEGTSALLIDLRRLLADDPSPPLFVTLPEGDARANARGIEHSIRVKLGERIAEGETRVFLSGQFSTLGRGAFLGDRSDSTVHPNYGHIPAMLPHATAQRMVEPELSTDAPFRYRELQAIRLDEFCNGPVTGEMSIDIRPFLAHAVPSHFDAACRDLPFHWDFEQIDRFIIDLEFDQPVEVMDLTHLQEDIATPGARYVLEATRIDARHVRIESRFLVTREQEEASDADSIQALLHAMNSTERRLRLRVMSMP